MSWGRYASNGGFDAGNRRGRELASAHPSKPKKTVFVSNMVAHVWAQQSQAYGRNAKASFYFDGPSLYSYGSHYIVAKFVKPSVVLFNAKRSTSTTEEHKSVAWAATSHCKRFEVGFPNRAPAENLAWFEQEAKKEAQIAANPRAGYYSRQAAISRATRLLTEAIEFQKEFFPRRKRAPFTLPDLSQYTREASKARDRLRVLRALREYNAASDLFRKVDTSRELLKALIAARETGATVPPVNIISVLKSFLIARGRLANLHKLIGSVSPSHWWNWAEHATSTAVASYSGDFRDVRRYAAREHRPRSFGAFENFIANMKTEAELIERDKQLEEARREYERQRAERQLAYEREQAERRRLADLSEADKISAWLNGADLVLPSAVSCRLRLNPFDPEEVETSQGARFPTAHAKRAWPLIKAVFNSGKEWHTNGHKIPLGHFIVSSIASDGTLVAGCHTLSKDEIVRFAHVLGLEE